MMAVFAKTGSILMCRPGQHYLIRRFLHGPRLLQETSKPVKRKLGRDAKVPRLIDKRVAQDVARALKPHLSQRLVYECCPGKGLLSEALLNVGVQHLVLLEPQQKYWSRLEDLVNRNEQVKLEKESLFQKRLPPDFQTDYMKPKSHTWSEGMQVQVVGIGHPKDIGLWMAQNAHAMATGRFPHHQGRAQLFLLVSGREHQLMVNQDDALGGMHGPVPLRAHDYQLYYRISTLLKIPKLALDGEVDYRSKVPKTATWDQTNYYLMEVTPRADLFTAICEKDVFTSFISFDQQLHRVRRANLIQRLEQWCPGLGLVALDMGYNMLDIVKNLQPQHLPFIFKEFQARGGLENLSFWTPHDDALTRDTRATVDLEKETSMFPTVDPQNLVVEPATLSTVDKPVKRTKLAQKVKEGAALKVTDSDHLEVIEEHSGILENEARLAGATRLTLQEGAVKKQKREQKKTKEHIGTQEEHYSQITDAGNIKTKARLAGTMRHVQEEKAVKKQRREQTTKQRRGTQEEDCSQLRDTKDFKPEAWLAETMRHIPEEKGLEKLKREQKKTSGQEKSKDSPKVKARKEQNTSEVAVASLAKPSMLVLEGKTVKKGRPAKEKTKYTQGTQKKKKSSQDLHEVQKELSVKAKNNTEQKTSWYEAPVMTEAVSVSKAETKVVETVSVSKSGTKEADAVTDNKAVRKVVETVAVNKAGTKETEAVSVSKSGTKKAEAVKVSKHGTKVAEADSFSKSGTKEAEALKVSKSRTKAMEAVKVSKSGTKEAEVVSVSKAENKKAEAVSVNVSKAGTQEASVYMQQRHAPEATQGGSQLLGKEPYKYPSLTETDSKDSENTGSGPGYRTSEPDILSRPSLTAESSNSATLGAAPSATTPSDRPHRKPENVATRPNASTSPVSQPILESAKSDMKTESIQKLEVVSGKLSTVQPKAVVAEDATSVSVAAKQKKPWWKKLFGS